MDTPVVMCPTVTQVGRQAGNISFKSLLEYLILVDNKGSLGGEFHQAVPFYLVHLGHLEYRKKRHLVAMLLFFFCIISSPSYKLGYIPNATAHLNVRIVAFRHEGDVHWEEVVWPASYAELQTSTFVVFINDRQAPFENVFPAVVAILAIEISDNRGPYSRPASLGCIM